MVLINNNSNNNYDKEQQTAIFFCQLFQQVFIYTFRLSRAAQSSGQRSAVSGQRLVNKKSQKSAEVINQK